MDYSKLVEVYEFLEKTPGRLEKTAKIAQLLAETPSQLLPVVVPLMEGRVFPPWVDKEMGIAGLLMIKIISTATGYNAEHVSERFDKLGDLGLVAEELLKKKRQQALFAKRVDVGNISENLQRLAEVSGKGSQERKFRLASELLSSASPPQAKYIVRTVLGTLRTGASTGVIRDAVVKAFFADVISDADEIVDTLKNSKKRAFLCDEGLIDNLILKGKISEKEAENIVSQNAIKEKSVVAIKAAELWKKDAKIDSVLTLKNDEAGKLKTGLVELVEWAWYMRPDYGEIAQAAAESGAEGLGKIKVKVGEPLMVLLAEKSPSLQEALDEFEEPAIEIKYDGVRLSVHRKGEHIWLFTRKLEDVTAQFPEVAEMAKKAAKVREFIIEGEMVAVDSQGRPLPFQYLSQRVQRKYEIEKLVKEVPVKLNLFDIVYADGEELFEMPLKGRRKRLEKAVKEVEGRLEFALQLITKDLKKAEEFYRAAIEQGQEGVMVKNLNAEYQPGRRVGYWLKVKPALETLDLAIVGAVWGTGKRAGVFSSLILGCRSGDGFAECGMLGTGIKEKKAQEGDITFEEITKILKPHVISVEKDRIVIKPAVVIEVEYEEIQKSPNYNSGYALRFPRFVRIRTDKGPEEADDIGRVQKIYEQQKGKMGE